MDKAGLLCSVNRFMMQEFSIRTIDKLNDYKLFKILLPTFKTFLEINLEKEVEKDSLVIQYAAKKAKSSQASHRSAVTQLLDKARVIDQKFVQRTSIFPIAINIRYHDIERIRQQRIELQICEVCKLFNHWQHPLGLRAVITNLYTQQQFRELLKEVLHLYSMETRMLSNSIEIPRILNMARDSLGQKLFNSMERSADEISSELSIKNFAHI